MTSASWRMFPEAGPASGPVSADATRKARTKQRTVEGQAMVVSFPLMPRRDSSARWVRQIPSLIVPLRDAPTPGPPDPDEVLDHAPESACIVKSALLTCRDPL